MGAVIKFLQVKEPKSLTPVGALFKEGNLVHFIERHMIEGRSAEMISQNLQAAFDEYC
jgi:putative YphP/YqiW family bacilliredoxin